MDAQRVRDELSTAAAEASHLMAYRDARASIAKSIYIRVEHLIGEANAELMAVAEYRQNVVQHRKPNSQ